jgi:hypothetical protein
VFWTVSVFELSVKSFLGQFASVNLLPVNSLHRSHTQYMTATSTEEQQLNKNIMWAVTNKSTPHTN